ncbi:hypothetical protein PoB_005280400 [Plakobranchus ocellatus]|uniref:Uncharacterized protein n=1 Tax=Plakobranchus ocellatus TaxID=259542 RepID=A0AAV4C1B4_9GAST|nr:hypothetical protein PoB_005280400 [Plakobranchus ocellatus]
MDAGTRFRGGSQIMLLVVTVISHSMVARGEMDLDTAFDPAADALQGIINMVSEVRASVSQLAKQTMSQQLFVEERIRSDGHSGLKQVRSYSHGTDSYFSTTHISKGAASMHDHSNSMDILGMGEAVVVLNGVEFSPVLHIHLILCSDHYHSNPPCSFAGLLTLDCLSIARTRHNDYHLRQVSRTDTSYNAVEKLTYPAVPPEVLNKPTVQDQVIEMREWIKAFANQDHSVRDYRKYFRPLMCYIEGAWTLDKSLVEPFTSQRHSLEADTWEELQQQIRYTAYTGGKHIKENFAFLPTKIMSVNESTGEPVYSHWNYRLLCHPYSGDIPTRYLRLQDDLSYRQATRRTLSRVAGMRAARFRLSEFNTPQYTKFTLLDRIMAEIPGKDNIPPFLNEDPLEQTLYDSGVTGDIKLNTGYYHRMYRTGTPSASGTVSTNRGFSDEQLFFAETTQDRIAPVEFRFCFNKRRCVNRSTRFSFAIPFEIVYLTPLLTWNPYNLTIWENYRVPNAGGRRGSLKPDKALNGTSYINNYFLTPALLFANAMPDESDPADTVKGRVGVLDQTGNVVTTLASGTRILLPEIPGIGAVRLRYPVFPLHVEGSSIWKELEIVKMKLNEASSSLQSNLYYIKLYPTTVSGEHDHEFYMSKEKYEAAMSGQVVSATTSIENGHSHELDLAYNKNTGRLEYVRCGNQGRCWDWHPKPVLVVSKPGHGHN